MVPISQPRRNTRCRVALLGSRPLANRHVSTRQKKVLHLCVEFEWDLTKAAANKQKHGITFEEAATVFADPHTLIASDALHVDRFNILGRSSRDRTLVVVYAEKYHDKTIRIISARRATRAERQAYEEDGAF